MKTSNKKVLASLGSVGLVFAPFFAFAAGGTLTSLIAQIANWIHALVPIVMAIAFIYFIWAVIKFINSDGEEKAAARQTLINAVIGMAVMASVWGLSSFLANTVGVDQNQGLNTSVINPF